MELLDKNIISSRIAEIIKERACSVKDFAAELGIAYRTIHNYSSGRSEPTAGFFAALYRIGINLDWFVAGEGDMYRANRVIREPPAVYGKGATVVTTGVNNGHIVTAGSQSRRESGMSRESLLCVFISEFAKTHDADDLIWLEKQFERVVPEYKDWRNDRT